MEAAAVPGPPRIRGASGAVLTLVDQVVSSASNFMLGVVIARAGGAEALGAFGVAFLVWLAVVGINRALVTEPMTVVGGTVTGPDEMREGLMASVAVGLGAGVVLAIGGAGAQLVGLDGISLLELAPWLPSLLAQDYCRAAAFRTQRPDRALISDLTAATVQAAAMVTLLVLGVGDIGAFLAAWGLGATAGALVGMTLLRTAMNVRGGVARLRSLWPRSRWFLAEFGTAFPADQGYLLLLPVILGTAQFGLYRAGANLIGPVVVVFLAAGNVGLAECVRRFHLDGMNGLGPYAVRLGGAVLAVTVLFCGSVALFADPLLRFVYGPEFAGAAVVTYLVAGQYVLMAVGFGCGVAMKAANQMRQLWMVRAIGAVVSISAVSLFASWWGLLGAGVASVVAGAAYGLGVVIGYRVMRRRLPAGGPAGNTPQRRAGVHRRQSGRR